MSLWTQRFSFTQCSFSYSIITLYCSPWFCFCFMWLSQKVFYVWDHCVENRDTSVIKSRQINNDALRQGCWLSSHPLPPLFFWVCIRCFGEDYCLSVPDVKAVVMVLQPSEPRITITGSTRLVRPAGDLWGPLGVAPFKELHITSTVMKGDSSGGRECRGCLCVLYYTLCNV